jgi:DnaJ-domain-containing protein 1
MLDYFALLEEPRRPWIDPDTLKRKFFALSADLHPDRVHASGETELAAANRNFADLNAAWQCLREPKERLGHLLELELGARPKDTQDVTPAAMELFFEVGQLCREADGFLSAKARTASPLLQAQMFGQGMALSERLAALRQRIQGRREELLGALQDLNAAWGSAQPPGSPGRAGALALDRLEGIYRMFSYLARWSGQIQERVVQLSF